MCLGIAEQGGTGRPHTLHQTILLTLEVEGLINLAMPRRANDDQSTHLFKIGSEVQLRMVWCLSTQYQKQNNQSTNFVTDNYEKKNLADNYEKKNLAKQGTNFHQKAEHTPGIAFPAQSFVRENIYLSTICLSGKGFVTPKLLKHHSLSNNQKKMLHIYF